MSKLTYEELEQQNKELRKEVAKHKQVDDELKNSEQTLSLMMNSAPGIIYRLDSKGKIVFINEAISTLGYTREELIGTSILDIVHPEDREQSIYRINERRRGDRSTKRYELRLLSKDMLSEPFEDKSINIIGPVFLVDAEGFYYTETPEGKSVLGTLGIARDISERMKVEDAMKENEEKYRSLVNQLPVGIYRTTKSGKILHANPALASMLEYDNVEDLLKVNANDLHIEKKQRSSQLKEWRDSKGVLSEEIIMVTKTGREIYVRDTGKAILDENDEIEYFDGTFEDVTERRKAEAIQKALYNILDAAATDNTLEEYVKNVHIQISTLIDAKNFYVAISDDTKEGYFYYPYYSDEEDGSPLGVSENLSGGLTDYVFNNGQLLVDKNAILEMKEKQEAVYLEALCEQWMGVPLIKDGNPYGVVVIQSYSSPNAYTEEDLNILNYVSRNIEIATQRKVAEEELLKLRVGIELSNEAIFSTDINGVLTYVNPAFERLYGFKYKDIVGIKTPNILKSGKMNKEDYEHFWKTLLSKKAISGEMINVTKDGVLVDIDGSANPIVDKSGKIVGFIAIQRDITQSKKLERIQRVLYNILKAVMKTETLEKLLEIIHSEINTLMDAKNFYVALYDKDNDTYTFPYLADEYDDSGPDEHFNLGKGYTEYIRKNKEPYILKKDTVQKLLDSGKIELIGLQSESWMGVPLLKDEEPFGVVAVQSYSNSDAYNEEDLNILTYVSGHIAMAIQRKKAEEKLKEAEEFSQSIIDSSLDMIIAVDNDQRVTKFNSASQQTFGYSEKEMLGKHIEILYADEGDYKNVPKTVLKQKSFSGEVINIRKNGDTFPSLLSASVLLNSKGEVIGKVGVSRDITERKQMEQMLIQSEKMASIGTLASGVAHEVNTPIGYVNMNLRTMQDYVRKLIDYDDALKKVLNSNVKEEIIDYKELQKKYNDLRNDYEIGGIFQDTVDIIDESIDGSESVMSIVSNLRDFARDEDQEMKPANVNEGIDKSLRIVWNKLKYKADIITEFGDIPEIECDIQRLEQVFVNLLVNAAQAIEERGTISVKTHCSNNSVLIKISDTGKGISQEDITRIFDSFFTTKEPGEGTGLGLSVSSKIIHDHNGSIDVESEVGKGTSFIIKLPMKKMIIEYKMLIVDDSKSMRMFLGAIIKAYNPLISIMYAEDGLEAGELLNSYIPDVVLLDINLPGLNGLEICKRIKSDNKMTNTAVIIITGLKDTDLKERSIKAGACEFLRKPIVKKTLIRALDRNIKR